MEQRLPPPERILEVFADPSSVKEVVKGISLRIYNNMHLLTTGKRHPEHSLLSSLLPVDPTALMRRPRPHTPHS